MSEKQQEQLSSISDRLESVAHEYSAYWKTYSGFGTWQFWVNITLFLLPLVALWFLLDRRKAFRLGFFGLTIHLIATHLDLYGTSHKLWSYPFKALPYPPASFGVDGSLIPVLYMFFYQWTLNRRKNYYVYLVPFSVMFAYIIKPLMSAGDLFQLYNGTYTLLLLLYYSGGLLGKWITDIFVYAQEHSKPTADRGGKSRSIEIPRFEKKIRGKSPG